MKCQSCGKEFESKTGKRGGRPAHFCSTECRELEKFWNAFCRQLDKVEMTDSKLSQWAGDLFRKRNEMGQK